MKRNLIGILSLVVLSVLVSATGAAAQCCAKADVPFAFSVGSAQLPAGTYEISPVGPGNSSILIQNHENSAAAMSTAGREQPRNASPKLVFHRVGNSYFLAEVWRSSTAEGMIVPTSKQEKELEKEIRASTGKGGYEEVVVALN
jgi:hypothetical protein